MSTPQNSIDIDYIANLARIELSNSDRTRLTKNLESILDYFKIIQNVNVEGVEPTAHAFPIYNVWEDDIPEKAFTVNEALLNAPAQHDNQIEVPKVVE